VAEWSIVPFKDLLQVPLRSGINAPSRVRGSGVKLVNMGELFAHDRIGDIPMELAPLPGADPERYLLQCGDLLFARQSLKLEGAGRCCLVLAGAEPRTWEGHIIRARLDHSVCESDFYYYWFRSPAGRAAVSSIVEQVAAAGIRGSDLAQLPVPAPPLSEQRAIASVLRALDDKIDSNQRRAAIAELLLDALACELDGSNTVPLDDLVEVDRTSCTPASHGETPVDHFSLPAFDAGRLPDRTPGDSIKSNKLVVAEESVLVSRLNPSTNRTWFAVPERGVLAAASTEFVVLRPAKGIGIGAVWLAVRDHYFQSELARRATGTSGSHQRVRPSDVLAVEVPDVRALTEERRAEAESLLRLVHQARTESATLGELRDALLPELLSGRLRVPGAEDTLEAVS
jgi:type I restriction enzyme S subunit